MPISFYTSLEKSIMDVWLGSSYYVFVVYDTKLESQ